MKKFIIIILTCLVSFSALNAQNAPSLLINWNPETVATGGSSNDVAFAASSSKSDIDAVYGMWAPQSADNNIIAADASILLADRFAIRVQGANLKDNQSSTGFNELGTPTGKFFPSELLVGAGFAYKINAAIAVGVDVKALMAKYGENLSSNAYGADVSFAYSAKGLTAGVSVRNIGAKLPMLIRASGEYLVSGFRASAEVNYLLSGAIMASVGAEYGIKDMVFLRAGYHYGDAAKAVPSFASCGLGLKFFGVKLNASYLLGSKTLGGTMLFGLGYEF